MLPNMFVIIWDGLPCGVSQPNQTVLFKTELISDVKFFYNRKIAERLLDNLRSRTLQKYTNAKVVEIQFRIMDKE